MEICHKSTNFTYLQELAKKNHSNILVFELKHDSSRNCLTNVKSFILALFGISK